LAKAAELNDLPAATVTRRLQKLEHRLKCKLINRSARKFNVTLEGQKLYDECAYLVDSLQDQTRQFETSVNELSGKIKLLAPINLASDTLSGAWSSFMSEHEQIELEFVLNNHDEDFVSTQADFAIRIGPQQDSELHQVRIGYVKTVLVASPEYVERFGLPLTQKDLNGHRFVVGSTLRNWPLQNDKDNSQFQFRPTNPRVIVNELALVRQLTLDGQGISLLPINEVGHLLSRGQLHRVMPDWTGQDRNIYIVWATGKLLTRRAKLLIEHLKGFVANMPSLQGEVPAVFPSSR
jgi:LysR family transcriptional regulator AphB